MDFAAWSVIVGALLVLMALLGTVIDRMPFSTSMLYLGVGVAVSPYGLGLLSIDNTSHLFFIERLAQVVVLVSLFSAGLKLGAGLGERRWVPPLRLATLSMMLSVALVALIARWLLHWPWGACVLLGAILAPTDPVLASDVQVQKAGDRDRLRFALTGEGGLNDGTAFPFVLLGLGLLGLHDIGPHAWRWLAADVLWAGIAGPLTGGLLGLAIGRLVLFLRREHREAVGLDDFLALGLIGLSYGVAEWMHVNGFLAVFAAGIALRHLEQSQSSDNDVRRTAEIAQASPDTEAAEAMAVDPEHAPAFMAHAVLGFNEQIERIGEVAAVITIGAMLWALHWNMAAWWLVPAVLFVVRPVAALSGLVGSPSSRGQRWLISWFGIRGVGSLYYLCYAIRHGLPAPLAADLLSLTLSVIVASIIAHGVSVTPVMAAYERHVARHRTKVT